MQFIKLLAIASSFFAVYVSAEVRLFFNIKYIYQHLLLQPQTTVVQRADQSGERHCQNNGKIATDVASSVKICNILY